MLLLNNFLKRNKLSLNQLIVKLNFINYNNLLDFCKERQIVPCDIKEFTDNLKLIGNDEKRTTDEQLPDSNAQTSKKIRNKIKKSSDP